MDYNVEDVDGDLVEIQLVLEKSNGDDLDSQTVYDGPETDQEGGNYEFQNVGGNAKQVRLIATDTDGNTVESVADF